MFKRVLIANRGEIALRVVRCCIEMGVESVVAYSQADKDQLYVGLATQAICIGDAPAAESYLNQERLVSAALATGCDALHPGYGFLSENADFARLCADNGIVFIGPPPQVIERMGVKAAARELMQRSGVPCVPGSEGTVASAEEARQVAERIGYPVLIKASAGGGGRGMRRVGSAGELEELFSQARSEAIACFGNGDLYVEKLVENPKHVEIQIFADTRGNVVYLGERDCSIQRKNQKMMEESPCTRLTPELRQEMGEVAVRAARACGYVGAGTVEFVMDEQRRYYFIEMNTRIQVEHPVTEMVYGVDLVREQLRVAAGLPLSWSQDELVPRGHAIECRINAEDPLRGFMPCPGTVTKAFLPAGNGTRVDSALYDGYQVNPYYDSLIAKVICWAPTRLEAIRKMRRCLAETNIEGISTNVEFELFVLYHTRFLKGTYNTGFMDECAGELLELQKQAEKIAAGDGGAPGRIAGNDGHASGRVAASDGRASGQGR